MTGTPYDQELPGMPLAERMAAADAAAVNVRETRTPARIDITNEAEAARALRRAINKGALPGTYRRHGRLVLIDELDEMPVRRSITSHGGRNLVVREVKPSTLRRLVGEHAYAYTLKKESRKVDAPWIEIEASPTVGTCLDVLDAHTWPGVPALVGVTASPVLRPDKTLVQTTGYDEATGLYYAPALQFDPVPARPSEAEVNEARTFVVETILGDFPWVDKADLANYLALLISPILRTYNGSLTPLGAITAATAGTGKTLLAGDIIAALYGLTSRPWVDSDEEVRKSISTILAGSTKPVVLFDNVPEWKSVDSAMLAKLLTSAQWDDRLLGGNESIDVENDRLWMVTGNSMTFGGDIPSRTVLVRLDAKMSRPDLRDPTEFKIGNLQAWLTDPENAAELLRRLLVLIADWAAAGAPQGNYVMRQFTPWARAVGGLLDHHGVHGFLANRSALDAADDAATAWLGFAHMWHTQFGDTWKSTTEATLSAQAFTMGDDGQGHDPWQGQFPRDAKTGRLLSAIALGKRLSSVINKIYGGDSGYRIERDTDSRTGQNRYRVVKLGGPGATDQPAATPAAPPTPDPSLFDHDD